VVVVVVMVVVVVVVVMEAAEMVVVVVVVVVVCVCVCARAGVGGQVSCGGGELVNWLSASQTTKRRSCDVGDDGQRRHSALFCTNHTNHDFTNRNR